MPNIKSAKKKARQSVERRARNMHYKSTMRTKVKRVRKAMSSKDASGARAALGDAVRYIDIVSSKGVIHKRAASRKISRLSKAVNEMRS